MMSQPETSGIRAASRVAWPMASGLSTMCPSDAGAGFSDVLPFVNCDCRAICELDGLGQAENWVIEQFAHAADAMPRMRACDAM